MKEGCHTLWAALFSWRRCFSEVKCGRGHNYPLSGPLFCLLSKSSKHREGDPHLEDVPLRIRNRVLYRYKSQNCNSSVR